MRLVSTRLVVSVYIMKLTSTKVYTVKVTNCVPCHKEGTSKFIYNVITCPSTILFLWVEAENCRSDIELIVSLQNGNDDHAAADDDMGISDNDSDPPDVACKKIETQANVESDSPVCNCICE